MHDKGIAGDAPGLARQQPAPSDPTLLQLPVAGYPISEEAVSSWFARTYGRQPSEREVGTIIDQMAQREASGPVTGPNTEPGGWSTGPSAPPADRR